ncbi:MAG: tetratricopeptide repeat protein [Spirochaetes bacterium]|nr:tetratricopeptide repeat protein [Spirochaetota bacterium]
MKSLIIIIIISAIPYWSDSAEMILPESQKYLQAYYTKGDAIGWKVELKGKVTILSADLKVDTNVSDKAEDYTSASARLYNNIGISIGDVLYIIDENNLINGKIVVSSLFKTQTFGYLIVGKGKLRLVNTGDRVVKRVVENVQLKNASVYKSKGDIHREIGETGKAISFYKEALQGDKNNPEAHLSLGYLYLDDDMLEYAYSKFKEAEKYERRLYDNEDRYYLYRGLSEVRFKQAYYIKTTSALREKYINNGIEYCKKALNIYPDSVDVNYFLGIFYYRNAEPSDLMARDHLLRVITLDGKNIEAYLALAELYDKHDNKLKAVSYAERALKIDPANDRAKNIIRKLK